MRIAVFSFESNPLCDRPCYYLSGIRAAEAISRLQAERVGERAIRLFPREQQQNVFPVASRFDEAWQLRPSEGYSTWQMRSQLGMSSGYVDDGRNGIRS